MIRAAVDTAFQLLGESRHPFAVVVGRGIVEVVEEEVGGHYFAGPEWVGVVLVSFGGNLAGRWEFWVEDTDCGAGVYDELRGVSVLDLCVGPVEGIPPFER